MQKNYFPKEEGRVEKKKACTAGAGAQVQDLLPARRGSPSCTPQELFKQVSLSVAINRVGQLRNTTCGMFWLNPRETKMNSPR